MRSLVRNKASSSPVCKPPPQYHIAIKEGYRLSLVVARQAPPHHSCQGNACMQRDGGACWGLVVSTEDGWREELDKFNATVSPTWSNGNGDGVCGGNGRTCVVEAKLWGKGWE